MLSAIGLYTKICSQISFEAREISFELPFDDKEIFGSLIFIEIHSNSIDP